MKRSLAHFPFSPLRCPVFYGWPIVAAGAMGVVMSTPGQTIGVSVFTDSLISALGLTRGQLSAAYMLGTIGSALLLPWGGRLYDRVGSRIAAPVSALSMAAVLVALSQCDAIANAAAHLSGGSETLSGFLVVLACFLALRFSGQGMLAMSSNNMVAKWFDRRRGFAFGCTGVCVALGFSIAPLAFDFLIQRFGWRGAWIVMAIFIGGVFAGLALLFYRDNPEGCGLLPDGAPEAPPPDPSLPAPTVEPDWTRAQALRTWTFWTFSLALALFGMYMTGLTFHIVSVFDAAGMTRLQAVSIFLPASVVAVAVHLSAGWLSDRVPLNRLLMAMLAAQIVSSAGVMFLAPGWSVWMVIAGNGMAGGLFGLLSGVSWATYFGRRHLGAISGLHMSVVVMCSAMGPVMFSQSLAWTGTYQAASLACLLFGVALIFAATRANRPRMKPAHGNPAADDPA